MHFKTCRIWLCQILNSYHLLVVWTNFRSLLVVSLAMCHECSYFSTKQISFHLWVLPCLNPALFYIFCCCYKATKLRQQSWHCFIGLDSGQVATQQRAVDDSDSDTEGEDPRVELASSHSSEDDFDEQDIRGGKGWSKTSNKQPVGSKFKSSYPQLFIFVNSTYGCSGVICLCQHLKQFIIGNNLFILLFHCTNSLSSTLFLHFISRPTTYHKCN